MFIDRKKSSHVVFVIVLMVVSPLSLFSQTQRGLGIDAGMLFNSNQAIGFHYSITYNWLIKKYLVLSAGAMFYHTKPDVAGWSTASGASYVLDERIMHLNGIVSMTTMCPVIARSGLFLSGSFFFEPVPVNYISVDKTMVNGNEYHSETIGKFRYSGFSPGVIAEGGIYHDFGRGSRGLKVFLGFGIGWYDAYSAYRHCSLDHQSLSGHVPNERVYYSLSVKLIGL